MMDLNKCDVSLHYGLHIPIQHFRLIRQIYHVVALIWNLGRINVWLGSLMNLSNKFPDILCVNVLCFPSGTEWNHFSVWHFSVPDTFYNIEGADCVIRPQSSLTLSGWSDWWRASCSPEWTTELVSHNGNERKECWGDSWRNIAYNSLHILPLYLQGTIDIYTIFHCWDCWNTF